MERHYETVYIVKPDIGEDAIKGIVGKAAKTVEDGKGTDVEVREWGRRKLAYPIQKQSEGYYFLMLYTAPPPASKELERTLRLNEDVIRYQTVRLNERPPVLVVPPVDDGGSDKVASGSGADAEVADKGGSDKVNADVSAEAEPVKDEEKGGGDGE
jgi:small subunit ribosomal protein S6